MKVAAAGMTKKKAQARTKAATPARGRSSRASQPGRPAKGHAVDDGLSRAARSGDDSQHVEIRIWLRLLSCTTRIENALKSRLRSHFGTTLARFDVLAQLNRFEHGLTMTELSRRLLVSNGAITGLVDKLVADRLVFREAHATDKRTVIVRLTTEGRAQFCRMALPHEEWVVSLLGDLPREARAELLQNLTSLKRHLDGLATKPDETDGTVQEPVLADKSRID
jgi:DNA-binding MarR family transcriptional regulator